MATIQEYLAEAVKELRGRVIPDHEHNLYLNLGAAMFAERLLEQFPEESATATEADEYVVPDNVVPFPSQDE